MDYLQLLGWYSNYCLWLIIGPAVPWSWEWVKGNFGQSMGEKQQCYLACLGRINNKTHVHKIHKTKHIPHLLSCQPPHEGNSWLISLWRSESFGPKKEKNRIWRFYKLYMKIYTKVTYIYIYDILLYLRQNDWNARLHKYRNDSVFTVSK